MYEILSSILEPYFYVFVLLIPHCNQNTNDAIGINDIFGFI